MQLGLMNLSKSVVSRGAAALLAIGLFVGSAAASPLTDAYSAGYVGERPDGYVALVDNNAPASVRQLVDQINAQRMQAYQSVAAQTGAPIDQVGIRAAQRIYSEVPAGTYLLSQSGNWYTK